MNAKQEAFLREYSECGNIRLAARLAEVGRSTHYHWIETDPEYSRAFDVAHTEAVDALEAEARRRAVSGIEEPVIYQGELQYERTWDPKRKEWVYLQDPKPLVVRKYSDVLLIFLLKAANPAKYRDNAKIEHTGPDGGPLLTRNKIDLTNLTDEQLSTLEQLARAAAKSRPDRSGETAPETEPDPALLPE